MRAVKQLMVRVEVVILDCHITCDVSNISNGLERRHLRGDYLEGQGQQGFTKYDTR